MASNNGITSVLMKQENPPAPDLQKLNINHKEEVEVLYSIFPERIRLVTTEDNSLPILHVSVPLNFKDNSSSQVKIDVYLNVEEKEPSSSATADVKEKPNVVATEKIPFAVRPSFERSVSGRRLHSTIYTLSPPQVEIYFVLSNNYPLNSPPDFTISSFWLSDQQLSVICKKLDSIWEENKHNAILFLWLDWLENESLSYLGITSIILNQQREEIAVDYRISNANLPVEERLIEILKYEMQNDEKLFSTTIQTCPVCFDTKPGSEFCRLDICWHYACCECLQAYIQMHVHQGTIQYLSCPDEKCKSPIPVNVLKRFLTGEQWERWDNLSLSKAIENIDDLDWCPRCRMPCEKERDHATSLLARCPYCSYAFCTSCRESWHQGTPCKSLEEKLTDLESTMNDKSADSTEQVLKRMKELKNQILSIIKLKITTKPCPGCLVPIEKNMGCNHVICIKCNTHMCWVCGKRIGGYEHFSSSGTCQTFTRQLDDGLPPPNTARQEAINEKHLELVATLEVNPELRRNVLECPSCRTQNLKTYKNNHLRCYACRTSYCFMCRKRITGTVKSHYGPGTRCQQHSDDN